MSTPRSPFRQSELVCFKLFQVDCIIRESDGRPDLPLQTPQRNVLLNSAGFGRTTGVSETPFLPDSFRPFMTCLATTLKCNELLATVSDLAL